MSLRLDRKRLGFKIKKLKVELKNQKRLHSESLDDLIESAQYNPNHSLMISLDSHRDNMQSLKKIRQIEKKLLLLRGELAVANMLIEDWIAGGLTHGN